MTDRIIPPTFDMWLRAEEHGASQETKDIISKLHLACDRVDTPPNVMLVAPSVARELGYEVPDSVRGTIILSRNEKTDQYEWSEVIPDDG